MATTSLRLDLMSFPDVEAAICRGATSIIVPCGAIEQHGPHLPLCMDADHADQLAVLVAERLGRTLVAPTIRVGCSSHHMSFAGTVSLRKETFEAICQDYCVSLARHGFKRILLFSAHLGNCPVLADILPRLRAAVPEDCSVEAFSDSSRWIRVWQDAVAKKGGEVAHVGAHADIAETSLMLVLRPEAVVMSRAEAGHVGLLQEGERQIMWRDGIAGISRNGVLGDPRSATPAIGEQCLSDMAGFLAAEFSNE